MTLTSKNYLDFAGLQQYDTKIKNYIDTEDAKSIKFAKLSEDENKLLLYKDKNASSESTEASADFTIPMGSAALKTLIKNLGTAVGATYSENPEGFSVSFTGDISESASVVAAVQAVNNHIGALGSLTTTDKTSIVAAINELVTAIANLDVAEFALTENNNDIISIYGIKETDGIIAKGTSKVDLAKVAKTGAASDVSTTVITDGDVEDPQTLYSAGNTQGVLESIARDLNTLSDSSKVTVTKQATAETGYAATYVIAQGGVDLPTKINIPLDYLVKNAEVKTWDGQGTAPVPGMVSGEKYIDFTINVQTGAGGTESHLYIAVNDLVHPISGGTTTVANEYELQVSVSATNEITATLNNIYAKKVLFVPSSATTVLTSVTNVKDALDAIDTKIQAMDADLDATTDASITDQYKVAVVTGITEADGTITAVDSIDVDRAGAATAAYDAIGSIAMADINGLFS